MDIYLLLTHGLELLESIRLLENLVINKKHENRVPALIGAPDNTSRINCNYLLFNEIFLIRAHIFLLFKAQLSSTLQLGTG